MNTVRLTITPEIRTVLDDLKLKYPPLSEPEILKVALSELYSKNKQEKVNMEKLTAQGKQFFTEWLKKRGKNIDSISEDEVYNLIENA